MKEYLTEIKIAKKQSEHQIRQLQYSKFASVLHNISQQLFCAEFLRQQRDFSHHNNDDFESVASKDNDDDEKILGKVF